MDQKHDKPKVYLYMGRPLEEYSKEELIKIVEEQIDSYYNLVETHKMIDHYKLKRTSAWEGPYIKPKFPWLVAALVSIAIWAALWALIAYFRN